MPKNYRDKLPDREVLSRAEMLDAGLDDYAIKKLVASGDLSRERRGVYRRVGATPAKSYDLVAVACTVKQGVFVLISALSFHGIGTEIPREVWLQIPIKARPPKIDWPPLRLVRSSLPEAAIEGVAIYRVDGKDLPITTPARTVVDCFRHRNKIGLDVFLEALRETIRSKKASLGEIEEMARKLRVGRQIIPYLEAIR